MKEHVHVSDGKTYRESAKRVLDSEIIGYRHTMRCKHCGMVLLSTPAR